MAPGGSSAGSPAAPGSPSPSGRTPCGTPSSPLPWTPACHSGMSRKPRPTQTRGPPCAMTGPEPPSTGTPPTSSPPTSPEPPDRGMTAPPGRPCLARRPAPARPSRGVNGSRIREPPFGVATPVGWESSLPHPNRSFGMPRTSCPCVQGPAGMWFWNLGDQVGWGPWPGSAPGGEDVEVTVGVAAVFPSPRPGAGTGRGAGCPGQEPERAVRASRGTRYWASGLPQPVTGSQPGPAL